MPIENYPVWSFEPNWSSSVTEMLEWLTDVMTSPDGSEQRRSLRFFPRRSFEFAIMSEGDERQMLDNMLISFGGSKWYLPKWHEVNVIDSAAPAGATFIASDDAASSTLIKAGSVVCLIGDSPYDYELAEIASVSTTGLVLTAPLERDWADGAFVYEVCAAELTDQPQLYARTSNMVTAEIRFRVLEVEHDVGEPPVIAGPLIVDGLIVNAYHQETGRGGYFHHNSGTSEGQFIFIYGCFLAYEQLIDGTPREKSVADFYLNLALEMLDAMGDGGSTGPMLRQEPPANPNTITLIHWLFAARGDIPGQKIVYSYEVAPVGNTLTIPSNANGGSIFTVWQIYPGTSELLFESPFSPAFDINTPAGETQIALSASDWTQSNGQTVITIPSGTPASATWKVVYGYNTEQIIPQGDGFEAYPTWTKIEPGYAACAPDTFRWFEQAMSKAIQHDPRSGKPADWSKLRAGMRRTAVKGQAISDLREVIQPMVGFDAIPVKGAPDGMYCYSDHIQALSPSVIGANPDWRGYNFWSRAANGDIVGVVPSGGAYTLSITFTADSLTESVVTINGQNFTTKTYGTFVSLFLQTTRKDAVQALADSINSSADGISALAYDDRIELSSLSPMVVSASDPSIQVSDYTSAVPQVQIGRGFSDQWRVAATYQEADQFLYVSISATDKPVVADKEYFLIYVSSTMSYDENARWYADIGSLAEFVPTTGNVIEFFIPRSAFKLRNYEPDGSSSWGATLPTGTIIENFGVSSEMKSAYSIRLREMRLVSGPSAEWVLTNKETALKGSKMPFFPGALPFAINADLRRQQFVGWNGSPFHGYQLADFWWWLGADADYIHPALTVSDLPVPNPSSGALTFPISPTTSGGAVKPKNALLMEQQLMFLRHAQDQWAADGGPNGFFAHTFVLNTPARASLGNPTPHTWVYTNDDPNTRWVGYQTRIVESLAELLLLTDGDEGFSRCREIALSMVNAWLARLNALWPNLNGKVVGGVTIYGMPTDFPDPAISMPLTLYEEPHAAAHILRACLTMRLAGVGETALLNALIVRCWTYLEMMWRTAGEMRYTWSPDPAARQWYGFWHGDIITTIALMLDAPEILGPLGIDEGVLRQRLTETSTWLSETGIGSTRSDADAGLTDVYRQFYVLTLEPNFSERVNQQYERNFVEIDNSTSTPERFDEAKRPFTLRQCNWALETRAEHALFAKTLQAIRGRSQPLWIPTFMDDFIPRADIAAGASVIQVARCGFTAAGGPRWDRQDIMIETIGGSRIYRRIVDSAQGPSGETIEVDRAFEDTYLKDDILRITFITLMRLNHDGIEIEHEVDTHGVSNVSVTFRSAPDTRIPESAFNE